MKREIVCITCREKLLNLFPTDNPYPLEHVKFVDGKARKEFFCDHCGREINTTEKCTAVSIWADYGGIPYFEWEPDYLFERRTLRRENETKNSKENSKQERF